MASEIIRRTIHYRGMVQGVGFRWRTLRTVEGLEVTGYVQNLPDGRVELVFEGTPEAIETGAARVRRELGRYISGESTETTLATREFRAFGIRR